MSSRYTPDDAEVAIRALEEIESECKAKRLLAGECEIVLVSCVLPVASRALATIRERAAGDVVRVDSDDAQAVLTQSEIIEAARTGVNAAIAARRAAARPGEAPSVWTSVPLGIRQDVEAHFGPLVRPGSQGEAKATGKHGYRPYPKDWPPQYNGSTEACDMLIGPCACGAAHADGDLTDPRTRPGTEPVR